MNIWEDVLQIRSTAPLVLNITNYVVMNTTANALLAIGASPVMAHAIEEVEELVAVSGALVINIGTLSAPWIEAMLKAGKAANRLGVPVVLDPVGCGATTFRTTTAKRLIDEVQPTVIRCNASEVKALIGSGAGKGVDARHAPDEVCDDSAALSRRAACVVSVSGAVDLIVAGDQVSRVANGHSMMTRVTGMGCTATAITGAFLATGAPAFRAAVGAMAVMGIVGEITGDKVSGPGGFQSVFLDGLYGLTAGDFERRRKIDCPPEAMS